jgi:hypothetical protein
LILPPEISTRSRSKTGTATKSAIRSGILHTRNIVSVIDAAPVIKPEIYATLLAGLGLQGFAARRRKQQCTPTHFLSLRSMAPMNQTPMDYIQR